MNYLEEYKKWCESDEFDEETKKELYEIKDNPKEIEDRFYKELEFGTAGLRWSNKYVLIPFAFNTSAEYLLNSGDILLESKLIATPLFCVSCFKI